MSAADKVFNKHLALVQPLVPEAVRAVAVFQRNGHRSMACASGGRWEASIGGPAFPVHVFLAVSDTSLYAFEAKGGFAWTVRELVGRWPLGELRSESEDRKVTMTLRLDVGDGTVFDLETMSTMANARNVEVVDLLATAG